MANELEEDPERAETFLAEVHREAEAEIEAAGGTVERGIAGALIATFGAPQAREEDHALRAVSAALATRKRLGDVFGETLWVRMSVESGEVILGRPGSFVTRDAGRGRGTARPLSRAQRDRGRRTRRHGDRRRVRAAAARRRLRARRGARADPIAGADRPPAQTTATRCCSPARSSLVGRGRERGGLRHAPTRHHRAAQLRRHHRSRGRTRWSGTCPSGRGRTASRSARTPSGWRTWTTRRCRAIDPEKRTVARHDPARRDSDRTRGRLRRGLGRARTARDGVAGRAAVHRRRNDSSSLYTARRRRRRSRQRRRRRRVRLGRIRRLERVPDRPGVTACNRHDLRREHAVRHRVRQPVRLGRERARQQSHAHQPDDERAHVRPGYQRRTDVRAASPSEAAPSG